MAAEYGRQAVQIIESGVYTAPSGRVVDISGMLERSVRGTRGYPPAEPFPEFLRGSYPTRIEVVNETTLSAVRRLRSISSHPVALNFASATHPGGGFLGGARAQEEYLARSAGLYAYLRDHPMYEYHRSHPDALYSNHVIYSPEVPVFRSDDGPLLEEPCTVGIITSPAVNRNAIPPERHHEIAPAMWARILKVLSIGLAHGHDAIVLGAWGCGAFGNNGQQIAGLFHKALTENFSGAYRNVVFAIVDWSPEKRFVGPFQEAFEEKPVKSIN